MSGGAFKNILLGCLLAAVTVAAYLPAMGCGFIWDDDDYVTNNSTLRDLSGLRRIWTEPNSIPQWYPVVHTTFWAEYHLWGLDAFGYHLVNVLLHCISAMLLWAILKKLEIPGAYLAAAIFALHPVHVESVAWITERKNVLSGVFYLAAVLAYLRFSSPRAAGPAWRSWPFLALAAGLFGLALLSKTVTASMPAAILVALWWRRGQIAWGDVAALVPLLIVGAAMGMYTAAMERVHVGAVGPEWDRTFADRCIVAAHAVWFYAGKLIWPVDLTFIYPRWVVDTSDWRQYGYLVALAVATAAAITAAVRYRSPAGRAPLAAGLFFVGSLFPALGFFNVYPHRFSFVADHFQYLASIGVIVLVAGALAAACGRLTNNTAPAGPGTRKWTAYLPVAAACIIVASLAGLTAMQGRLYANLEELWSDTIRKNDKCWLAWNNLGVLYTRDGPHKNLAAAAKCFQNAIDLNPNYDTAVYNMGVSLVKQSEMERQKRNYRIADELRNKAEQCYRRAIELKPNYAGAYHGLGAILADTGRLDEALTQLSQAVKCDPNSFEFRYSYAKVLLYVGKSAQAVEQLRRAAELAPDSTKILVLLSEAHEAGGEYVQAVATMRRCVQLEPANAAIAGRAAWLMATCPDEKARDADEALRLAQKLCQTAGFGNAEALETLAAAQARTDQYEQAVKTASAALDQARTAGNAPLVDHIAAELELYRAGKPYTQLPKTPAAAASAPASVPAASQPRGNQ